MKNVLAVIDILAITGAVVILGAFIGAGNCFCDYVVDIS